MQLINIILKSWKEKSSFQFHYFLKTHLFIPQMSIFWYVLVNALIKRDDYEFHISSLNLLPHLAAKN